MWIDQMCRLCAQVSEVIFPIFEKNSDKPRLEMKIKKCLSLVISENDCKPKQICYNCTTKLEDYYDFLQICESSDYKFESILYAANSAESTEQLLLPRARWNAEKPDDSLPEQLSNQTQAVTVPHNGVIVVGKVDESQANINRECQDILLMVELKYKDVEIDPQSEILKDNKILYAESDALNTKSLASVFPQSVLRHSDDINKLQYSEPHQPQRPYPEQQYTNCIEPVKSKPFPCSQCNKAFMRRSNLNAHMSTHTDVRPFHCDQCDRSFALRWNLTVHQRLHTGLYTCEYCGKAFPVKGKLERHRRIHTGEKPFACNAPNCDKAFADKRNLEAHIRTHSSDRPFACEICARTFRSRSHLVDHQRVHSEEAPFTCHTCGKSFKWKTNLTIHLKSHTGEKSTCTECGKQFTRSTQLIKHRKLHHGLTCLSK